MEDIVFEKFDEKVILSSEDAGLVSPAGKRFHALFHGT